MISKFLFPRLISCLYAYILRIMLPFYHTLVCFKVTSVKKEKDFQVSLTRISNLHQVHDRVEEEKKIEIFSTVESFDHVIFVCNLLLFLV